MYIDEGDCTFENLNVRISDSGIAHLHEFNIEPYTLCDMLASTIDCPKRKKTGKAFRKTSKRVCSRCDGKTYNIILDRFECTQGSIYWSVSHLEPI